MESKHKSLSFPTIFAVVLLSLAGIGFGMYLLGYWFSSSYEIVLYSGLSAATIYFTTYTVKKGAGKTKLASVVSAILPLIAIFYLVNTGASAVTYSLPYAAYSAVIAICSLTLFFSYKRRAGLTIGLGIPYVMLMAMLLLWFFLKATSSMLFGGLVVKSELSPNGVFLAEVMYSDQGALGGDTYVNITQQNRDIDFGIGALRKVPREIYVGKVYAEAMPLRWEGDEVLFINGARYEIR